MSVLLSALNTIMVSWLTHIFQAWTPASSYDNIPVNTFFFSSKKSELVSFLATKKTDGDVQQLDPVFSSFVNKTVSGTTISVKCFNLRRFVNSCHCFPGQVTGDRADWRG